MTALASYRAFGYRYPDAAGAALGPLDLELGPGLSLVTGGSGSGKSTLLRSLNGLVPHFHGGSASGGASILGHDLRTTPTRVLARQVAMVFQEPEAQFVLATVGRELAFGPENLGLPRREVAERVEEALAVIGLGALAERRIGSLSGGQRQRVAIAAALAMRPELLVLDEPTSQLDREGAEELRQECRRLTQRGTAVVVAEHRPWRLVLEDARWLRLERGRVLETSPSQLEVGPVRHSVRAPGESALELRRVAVGHDSPVLEGVELSGRRGEVLCLTGPNGSGKTTLLRTAAGLLRPLSGTVWRRPGRAAYLPQEPGGVLHLPSVGAEVRQTIRWLRLEADPQEAIRAFGLERLEDRDPRDLSTGQRQRAALAAVLVGDPEMVFLDEPTRGADPRSRALLAAALDRLAERGSAVLVATSDAEFAERIADRVLELVDGSLRAPAGVGA